MSARCCGCVLCPCSPGAMGDVAPTGGDLPYDAAAVSSGKLSGAKPLNGAPSGCRLQATCGVPAKPQLAGVPLGLPTPASQSGRMGAPIPCMPLQPPRPLLLPAFGAIVMPGAAGLANSEDPTIVPSESVSQAAALLRFNASSNDK
eukprot:scaffold1232_cov127-Isochrysis_galbana.AAC.2